MSLQTFEPCTRLACCATCEAWYADGMTARCPVIKQTLPNDLTGVGCDCWTPEIFDSYARDLYDELVKEGVQ